MMKYLKFIKTKANINTGKGAAVPAILTIKNWPEPEESVMDIKTISHGVNPFWPAYTA